MPATPLALIRLALFITPCTAWERGSLSDGPYFDDHDTTMLDGEWPRHMHARHQRRRGGRPRRHPPSSSVDEPAMEDEGGSRGQVMDEEEFSADDRAGGGGGGGVIVVRRLHRHVAQPIEPPQKSSRHMRSRGMEDDDGEGVFEREGAGFAGEELADEEPLPRRQQRHRKRDGAAALVTHEGRLAQAARAARAALPRDEWGDFRPVAEPAVNGVPAPVSVTDSVPEPESRPPARSYARQMAMLPLPS